MAASAGSCISSVRSLRAAATNASQFCRATTAAGVAIVTAASQKSSKSACQTTGERVRRHRRLRQHSGLVLTRPCRDLRHGDNDGIPSLRIAIRAHQQAHHVVMARQHGCEERRRLLAPLLVGVGPPVQQQRHHAVIASLTRHTQRSVEARRTGVGIGPVPPALQLQDFPQIFLP